MRKKKISPDDEFTLQVLDELRAAKIHDMASRLLIDTVHLYTCDCCGVHLRPSELVYFAGCLAHLVAEFRGDEHLSLIHI